MKRQFTLEGIALHVFLYLFFFKSALASSSPANNNLSSGETLLPFETIELIVSHGRMNAATFYRQLVDWFMNNVTDWNMFLIQSLATCGSLIWLLFRAWYTLWKPVPELISILGIEVPDAPVVSLAGIQHNSITLRWSPPGATRKVERYLIQVNGVNVGESSYSETAITVTGLRPAHFYNVRVIAIGLNNFQAQSAVLRLRTYAQDGRPILANGRVLTNSSVDENKVENEDDAASGSGVRVGIEAIPVSEPSQAMPREQNAGHLSQRRNTGGRKHSPSVAADQPPLPNSSTSYSEESMQELTEKFEAIRKETEEILALIIEDKEKYEKDWQELGKDRDDKKTILDEKEKASAKLKREVHQSEVSQRQAQARKAQKEKGLHQKKADISKMHDDMARWKDEIEEMMAQQEKWEQEKIRIKKERESKVKELQDTMQEHQQSLLTLEEDIKDRGLQIKELEEERQKLEVIEDNEATREQDEEDKREDEEWKLKDIDIRAQLNAASLQLRQIEAGIHHQQVTLSNLTAQQANNPIMYHGNSSGVDFDPTGGQGKAKSRRARNRKSRTNTVSSPITAHPIMDSPFPSASAYNNLNSNTSPSFALGPYIDMSNDISFVPLSEQLGMTEEDVERLTAGAPLSPTAHALLPSSIFADDDVPSPPRSSRGSFGPAMFGPYDHEHPSPNSSSRSASLMSSPQNSSQNLPMYGVASENDRRSLNSLRDYGAIGSPSGSGSAQTAPSRGFVNLLNFSRSRGKTMQEDGLALGSLKPGQSQSFPRSTDEPESSTSRPRRISFSSPSWGMPTFLRSSAPSTQGNAPAPARNLTTRRRNFNIFSSSTDDTGIYSERDPSSPRPLSIASSDLPRPSTDSAPFGWGPTQDHVINRNSPLATNWSHTVSTMPTTWSRNPSRRPSLQHHGSSSALAAEMDDSVPDNHESPPPGVGVIGTRPASSHKPVTPKLNPAAPAFKGFMAFRGSRSVKDKGKGKETVSEHSIEE